ncbi:MAG: phospholipase A, partial [Sinobacteraceae bacterium]|nr:phospholipase A [Nevskiaceae bacterium]
MHRPSPRLPHSGIHALALFVALAATTPCLAATASADAAAPAAASSTNPAPEAASSDAQNHNAGANDAPTAQDSLAHWPYMADPDAYSIAGAASGLSFHKPMYLEPYTYSPSYNGNRAELVFQISLKLQLFHYPSDGALYAAYTQKSFWEVYNSKNSRPFRETNYNPEIFYRYIPDNAATWHHMGIDFGAEHNSNGKGLPDSRSWNRLYIAPFQATDNHLIRVKFWWRIPQGDPNAPRTSSDRDDNPDIEDYYGYARLDFEQKFFGDQMLHIMGRYNPGYSRGAIKINYSFPGPGSHFFWGFFFFNGYGDSLLN